MGAEASRIFLSYRREDTRHMAGRLADRLDLRFGPGTVFMDVDAIEPGADFTKTIAEAVSSCDLLIALIGPDWLVLDERTDEPRIHEHDDFVAIEIKAALDRGIYVIPVLVDQAKMPTSAELPTALRSFATRNATRVDHETFSSDVERFLSALERILRTVAAERTARRPQHTPPGPERPDVPPQAESQHATSAQVPRIPPIRAALRIALWWIVYLISPFAAFVTFDLVQGEFPGGVAATVIGTLFVLGVLGGVVALLRLEIRAQRRMLRRAEPGAEARSAKSAVSVEHVRTVAMICAVVALGIGLLFAAMPAPTTPSGGGASTSP